MLDIAENSDYDWYFGLDADVVLKEGWIDDVHSVLKTNNKEYYRMDFLLKDRFVDNEIYGAHLYNNKYTKEVKEKLLKTKDQSKPEGSIRHIMSPGNLNVEKIFLGYHGYFQYRRDIFSRFALRYSRDKNFVKKHKIFSKMDEEKVVAKKGWDFAKECGKDFCHADNRSYYDDFYKDDLEPLDITLDEFYRAIWLLNF